MEIKLRIAEKNDWDFILNLRNDLYEFFYKQNKPIPRNDHFDYMEKQIENPNFHHWVITYSNNDVGYVRILDSDVSIMIKKEYQNKGIASTALDLLEKEALKLGIKKLIALVSVANSSSEKIFLKNDYKLKMHWLEKDI